MSGCPICRDAFYDLASSFDVCSIHQDYFVTVCNDCGRACFSQYKNICESCFNKTPFRFIPKGPCSSDKRRALREYGQDSWYAGEFIS